MNITWPTMMMTIKTSKQILSPIRSLMAPTIGGKSMLGRLTNVKSALYLVYERLYGG